MTDVKSSTSAPRRSTFRRALRLARDPVVIYAVLATVWIVVTDMVMLRLAPELQQLAWIGTAKGLVFVAITTMLLATSLLRERAAQARSAARLHLLETALSATASAVVITDRDGVIQWVNQAFTTLTGYPQSETVGQSPRLLRSGQHDKEFYNRLWATVLGGEVWRGEMLNRRRDGSFYHEEQTITPVRSDGTTITHFIGFKQDITARVTREREQRILATLAAALRDATTRAQLPEALVRHLAALFPAEGAALALYDLDTGMTMVEAGVGTLAPLAGARLPSTVDQSGRARHGDYQGLATGPLSRATLYVPAQPEALRASVTTPLVVDDEVIGALFTTHEWAPDDVERHLLRQVADMAASAIHRATLHEQTVQRLERLTSLHSIDRAIAAGLDTDQFLATALAEVRTQFRVDAAAVLLLDGDGVTLRYRAGAGFLADTVARTTVSLGVGLLGEAVLARRAIRLPLIPVTGETYTRDTLIAAEGFRAYYALPLIAKGQLKGALELFHRAPHASDTEGLDFLDTLAGHIALALDHAELVEHLRRVNDELAVAYDSTLEGWARALELRDLETEGHSRRVTALTEGLARSLGLPEAQIMHMRRGALLHDIGKLGVPDAILHKPGPLSADEWALMREHPTHAYRLLSPIAYLAPALDIPYAHHERWDGGGYPRGLVGEAIPLAARVFAVVDVWDALTTQRPYKPAWSTERARAFLREQAGTQFDPAIVAAFLALVAPADAHKGNDAAAA